MAAQNSPIRITDTQQAIAQRHTHPNAATLNAITPERVAGWDASSGSSLPENIQQFSPYEEGVHYTVSPERTYRTVTSDWMPDSGRYQILGAVYSHMYDHWIHPYEVWIVSHGEMWQHGGVFAFPTNADDIHNIQLVDAWTGQDHEVKDLSVVPFRTTEGFETHQIIGQMEAFDGNIYEVRITIGAQPFGAQPDSGIMLFPRGGYPSSSIFIKRISGSEDFVLASWGGLKLYGAGGINRFPESYTLKVTPTAGNEFRPTDRITFGVDASIRVSKEYILGSGEGDWVATSTLRATDCPPDANVSVTGAMSEYRVFGEFIEFGLPARVSLDGIEIEAGKLAEFVRYMISSGTQFELNTRVAFVDVKRI